MFGRAFLGVIHFFGHIGAPAEKIVELAVSAEQKYAQHQSLEVGASMDVGSTDVDEEGRVIEYKIVATRKS